MTDDEMANALRAIGWRVAPPLTPETCAHPNMRGSVTTGTVGTTSEWRCLDCGYRYRHSTPPVQINFLTTVPLNS